MGFQDGKMKDTVEIFRAIVSTLIQPWQYLLFTHFKGCDHPLPEKKTSEILRHRANACHSSSARRFRGFKMHPSAESGNVGGQETVEAAME